MGLAEGRDKNRNGMHRLSTLACACLVLAFATPSVLAAEADKQRQFEIGLNISGATLGPISVCHLNYTRSSVYWLCFSPFADRASASCYRRSWRNMANYTSIRWTWWRAMIPLC